MMYLLMMTLCDVITVNTELWCNACEWRFGFHGMYEGFLLPLLASFVRCYNDTYQHQLLVEQAENLNAIYDALNYLSSCPWKINTRVRKAGSVLPC